MPPIPQQISLQTSSNHTYFYEKIDIVCFEDWNLEFGAVPLLFSQLSGKGSDVLVRGVAPRMMDAGLGLYLIFIVDDVPSLEVGEELVDGFVVVANVFLPLILSVLRIDDLFD